jgi:SAM-dependent methyltransferase
VEFPLRLGAPADCARVAALFARAGFREEPICRGLGIPNISQVGKAAPAGVDLTAALGSATLAALVRVFVFTQMVPRAELEPAIDPPDLGALEALDLLRPGRDGSYYSPAFVYPVAGFVIASDRHDSPDGSDVVLASDVVFPALDAGTLRFLGVIARSPVGDALDLCSGTGIAALVLSRHVERVVAADITPRAAHFARFNALLNGRPNVEIAVGDLYEPVAERTFDRIVAHPPYVPALEQARVFRDGGDTGESILRRIVAELPRYLRPGGALYCVSAAWDAAEGPLESRIRRWLGEREREFDVIFAQQEEVAPERLARWLADKAAPGEPGAPALWEEHFRDAGLERNVYGAIVVHRVEAAGAGRRREPVTVRPRLSPRTDGSCFEWALRWYRWRAEREAEGGLSRALLDSRPRLGSRLRARVTHAPQAGGFAVTEILLQSDRPFRSATGIEPWMFQLVEGFGQGRTAREVYETARSAERLPEGFGLDDFATLVAMMVERGYIEVEESVLDA